MPIQNFRPNLSRSVMIQWFIFLILSLFSLFVFSTDLEKIYLSEGQTNTGIYLNGLIIFLFVLGMGRFIMLLVRYQREEKMLRQFHRNISESPDDMLKDLSSSSIIAERFNTLQQMATTHVEINHQALASTLIAAESTRTGLLRFVQNILILCGVFGTIVSLSIALFGASTLLESSVSSSGMGMVIHGMSTALSTTMTAIICYLSFTYFNGALQSVQTNFLSAIEHLTTTHLIPKLQITPDTIDRQLASLLRAMALLVQEMHQNQGEAPKLLEQITQIKQNSEAQHDAAMTQIHALQETLKQGFRLPQA